MAHAGIAYEPLHRWSEIPASEVEVEFDIEWDFENRIYLWGLRVRQGQDDTTAVFEPVLSYDPADDDDAAHLANLFAARTVIADAESAGRSVTVFRWSHPERSMIAKFPEVADLLAGRAFDLRAWFETHFLTQEGSSLKVVAPLFGFEWSVRDAGGAQSQVKIDLARTHGPEADAACEWLNRYNESDVAAQAAIRDGLLRPRAAATVE